MRLKQTNPAGSLKGSYGRGPTTGNKSSGDKMTALRAEKDSLQGLASEIVREAAGKAVKLGTSPDAGGIHANVSGKRGPTRGNQ